MDIREAIERNLAFNTEYGAGPRVLGGFLHRRVLKRHSYGTGGQKKEDVVHELAMKLGPVMLEHRSADRNVFTAKDYELAVSFFRLFVVSNDRDYWIKLRTGPSIGVLGAIPSGLPAAVLSAFLDCDLTARAGLRFNVSGFLRDLRDEETDAESSDPALWNQKVPTK